MYDRASERPMGESECKPDYEKLAATATQELKAIKHFKDALIMFIGIVGTHAFRRKEGSAGLAELLGTVELDILEREKILESYMKKLEE